MRQKGEPDARLLHRDGVSISTNAQGSEVRVVPATQALDRCSGSFALEPHHDDAVFERVGQSADRGDRLRRPGREPARLMIDVADDVGGGFGMTGV
jgi:hypothetical protein